VKILLVHNHYQDHGGEDEVFRREKDLLLDAGHEVIEYTRCNKEISSYGLIEKISLAGRCVWAGDTYEYFRKMLSFENPDVAHFHNTFPMISPSAYYACAAANVPVVQTLHNSRMVCPAATLHRNGQPCDDCAGRRFAWPAVVHSCYQGSRVRSTLAASMLLTHRWLDTWKRKVDKYVVFTEFYRDFFLRAGIAPEKIAVKPHFVECDPGVQQQPGSYALFVGRLVPEKGVHTLLKAWRSLPDVALKVRGDGPLAEEVQKATTAKNSSVTVVPRPTREGLFDLIRGARFLVWPSEGYNETFGLVAVEAFACGVPVIASNIGAMKEIVKDGETGLHCRPSDAEDLAQKVRWAWSHPEVMESMGRQARAEFVAKYTRERNYVALKAIYEQVLEERIPRKAVLAPAGAD
jgi:glycosyltransferase involved in cell wall biosynthesis